MFHFYVILFSFLFSMGYKVVKKNANISMSHKAHNGRVICAYTADVSRLAVANRQAEWPAATFDHQRGGRDRKLPMQAACMWLDINLYWCSF